MHTLIRKLLLLLLCIGSFAGNAQKIIYVNPLAQGQNNGNSWANAYKDLQNALQAAQKGDAIWVAKDVYRPTNGNDRKQFFLLKSGVSMYGGFDGTETNPDQRHLTLHLSVLEGDIGRPDDSTDNVYNILRMVTPGPGTLLDGFTLRNAVANDPTANDYEPGRSGGALYIDGRSQGAHPLIRRCTFVHNYAEFSGGAVFSGSYPIGATSSVFEDCYFEGNRSDRRGGAMFHSGGGELGTAPDFLRCHFYNNRSKGNGGALYFYDYGGKDTFQLLECRFENNHSDNFGGAFHENGRLDGSLTKVTNCAFLDNSARIGGAINHYSDSYKISYFCLDSCLFLRNKLRKADNLLQSRYGSTLSIYSGYEGTKEETEMVVQHCKFEQSDTSMGEIALWDGKVRVLKNTFLKNQYSGLDIVVISEILFQENQMDQNSLIVKLGAKKNYVINNIISNHQGRPLSFGSGTILTGNIFYNIQTNFRSEFPTALTRKPSFAYNNIFVNSRNTEPFDDIKWRLPFSNDSCLFFNNIFDFDDCDSMPSLWVCKSGNLYGANPMFLDAAAGDFRLDPCSPAINAGLNLPIEQLAIFQDYAGKPRLAEGKVDIGPYEHPGLETTAPPVVSPACPGIHSGKINFNLSGGCPPYQFTWKSGNAMGTGVDQLGQGTYAYTIQDNKGRLLNQNVTVTQAVAPVITDSIRHATCSNCADGAILSIYQSVTLPLSFRWNTGDTTPTLQNIPPGNYGLTITDGAGCQYIRAYTLTYKTGSAEPSGSQLLSVYPNPAADFIQIALSTASTPTSGTLMIRNALGAVVYSNFYGPTSPLPVISIRDWEAGVYFCQLLQDDFRYGNAVFIKR